MLTTKLRVAHQELDSYMCLSSLQKSGYKRAPTLSLFLDLPLRFFPVEIGVGVGVGVRAGEGVGVSERCAGGAGLAVREPLFVAFCLTDATAAGVVGRLPESEVKVTLPFLELPSALSAPRLFLAFTRRLLPPSVPCKGEGGQSILLWYNNNNNNNKSII